MIRIHYTEDLERGDEVLVNFGNSGSYSKYYVRDIKDQFVGLASREYSSVYNYYKISEIELYKDVTQNETI